MGKKKLKKRIAELEAEMAELHHKCRQCETCENYKPKTVTWRRFKPLEPDVFEKLKNDIFLGRFQPDTFKAKEEAEE